jgi:hypothetical protein
MLPHLSNVLFSFFGASCDWLTQGYFSRHNSLALLFRAVKHRLAEVIGQVVRAAQ